MHTRIPDFGNPNLVAYLRFDEGVNSFLTADASGNCNNGNLVNMDVINGTINPVWYISTIPLGTPAVVSQDVSASGNVTFPGGNASMDFYNYPEPRST